MIIGWIHQLPFLLLLQHAIMISPVSNISSSHSVIMITEGFAQCEASAWYYGPPKERRRGKHRFIQILPPHLSNCPTTELPGQTVHLKSQVSEFGIKSKGIQRNPEKMPKTQTFSDETFARRKASEARLSIYPMLKSEELRERVIFLKFNKRSGSLEK